MHALFLLVSSLIFIYRSVFACVLLVSACVPVCMSFVAL